jgi:hypothetical protein
VFYFSSFFVLFVLECWKRESGFSITWLSC